MKTTYRRRVFLINKGFQIRFSFYVCSWIILLNFAYPLIISNLLDYIVQYMAADPMGPGLAILAKARKNGIWTLVLMQGVFLGCAFLLSIFLSHRVAGPLYQLRKVLQKIQDGDIDQRLFFRKTDYFPELVPAFNDMMDSIRKRIDVQTQAMNLAAHKIEDLLPRASAEVKAELKLALDGLKNNQRQ